MTCKLGEGQVRIRHACLKKQNMADKDVNEDAWREADTSILSDIAKADAQR
jgi:hypothetical protein